MVAVTHLGCPGHFICADDCRYWLHTQIDGPGCHYRVSTIGEYWRYGKRVTVGAGPDDYFETLVFRTTTYEGQCGYKAVESWLEIDGRRSSTAGEALRTHEEFVAKWAAKAAEECSNAD